MKKQEKEEMKRVALEVIAHQTDVETFIKKFKEELSFVNKSQTKSK